jgi:hypothetical protein
MSVTFPVVGVVGGRIDVECLIGDQACKSTLV